VLSLRPRKDGYVQVTLRLRGATSTRYVHRIVADLFIGPCPEGNEVAHLDGVRANNFVGNLRYLTHRENVAHTAAHGTKMLGERHPMAKLDDSAIRDIRARRWETCQELADEYGCCRSTISGIRTGSKWRHVV
jgi:hypothetical protein